MMKFKQVQILYRCDAACFDPAFIVAKRDDLFYRIEMAINSELNKDKIVALLGNAELVISGEENLDD